MKDTCAIFFNYKPDPPFQSTLFHTERLPLTQNLNRRPNDRLYSPLTSFLSLYELRSMSCEHERWRRSKMPERRKRKMDTTSWMMKIVSCVFTVKWCRRKKMAATIFVFARSILKSAGDLRRSQIRRKLVLNQGGSITLVLRRAEEEMTKKSKRTF
jgi:hypothetical protein